MSQNMNVGQKKKEQIYTEPIWTFGQNPYREQKSILSLFGYVTMFHRITVPIDDNSSWDKTYNETQILSVEPSADGQGKFLFSLQLKSEKFPFTTMKLL